MNTKDFILNVDVPLGDKTGEIIKREEISVIISKYDASQKLLSRLLGWGEITLTRYMSGGYTPNAVNSDKLKSLRDPYVLQKIMNDKTEKEREDIGSPSSLIKLQLSVNRELEKMESKAGKIYQIVNWFLNQTSEDNPITHLALQKLLYFSQSWNKVWNGQWLFEDECEAWVHGAVYRNVYDEFKKFRYMPLPKVSTEVRLEEKEIEVLEFVKKYYFDIYSAKTLETICHLEQPYELAKEILEKKDIETYYTRIAREYHISKDNQENIKGYLNALLA